jgi:hypothetical protein
VNCVGRRAVSWQLAKLGSISRLFAQIGSEAWSTRLIFQSDRTSVTVVGLECNASIPKATASSSATAAATELRRSGRYRRAAARNGSLGIGCQSQYAPGCSVVNEAIWTASRWVRSAVASRTGIHARYSMGSRMFRETPLASRSDAKPGRTSVPDRANRAGPGGYENSASWMLSA